MNKLLGIHLILSPALLASALIALGFGRASKDMASTVEAEIQEIQNRIEVIESNQTERQTIYELRSDLEELDHFIKEAHLARSRNKNISRAGSIGVILFSVGVIITSFRLRTRKAEPGTVGNEGHHGAD